MSGSPLDPLRARSVFSASPVLLTSNGPLVFRTGSSPILLLSPFLVLGRALPTGKGGAVSLSNAERNQPTEERSGGK